MDPVTAAILIGMAVSTAVGVYQNNKAVKARNAANKEQEKHTLLLSKDSKN